MEKGENWYSYEISHADSKFAVVFKIIFGQNNFSGSLKWKCQIWNADSEFDSERICIKLLSAVWYKLNKLFRSVAYVKRVCLQLLDCLCV